MATFLSKTLVVKHFVVVVPTHLAAINVPKCSCMCGM